MAARFAQTVFGNVAECRTEIEISLEGMCVAVVYETEAGWQTQFLAGAATDNLDRGLQCQIEAARDELTHYVNRRGTNPPAALTAPGLSLWLMARDDGTAMGQAVDA